MAENILEDYPQNVWTDAESANTITDEFHWAPNASPYEIQIQELPQENDPSDVTVEVVDIADEAILIGDGDFDVQNDGWFTIGNSIQVDDEEMLITNIIAPALHVDRAQNGTAAAAHDNRSPVRILNSMTEQAKTASEPPVGYFQVDYETGLIRLNSADTPRRISISYSGLGQLCCEKWNADLGYLFGDGSDGAVEVSHGDTLQIEGEKNYTNLTIAGTLTYSAAPTKLMEIRVSGTLWIKDSGIIDANGFGAALGTDGYWGGASGGNAGAAGKDHVSNTMFLTMGGGGALGGGNGEDALPVFLMFETAGLYGAGGLAGGTLAGGGIKIYARRIILESGATIRANGIDNGAIVSGGGGGVVVYVYQELTDKGATITANGGVTGSGNGGAGLVLYYPV